MSRSVRNCRLASPGLRDLRRPLGLRAAGLIWLWLLAAPAAWAVPISDAIENRSLTEQEGVDVTQKFGSLLPLRVKCLDENASGVLLEQYFQPGRVVLFTMNYSTCPLLCSEQLEGLCRTFQQMEVRSGEDFVVVSVSYDPHDTPERSLGIKRRYLGEDERHVGDDAWNFLVTKQATVAELTAATGISFRHLPEKNQYVHPAVTIVCTPDGRVSQYFHGTGPDPGVLEAAIRHAASGQIAAVPLASYPVVCFFYDETAGVYTVQAVRVMQLGGVLTLMFIAGLWWMCQRMVKFKEAELARTAAAANVVAGMGVQSPAP